MQTAWATCRAPWSHFWRMAADICWSTRCLQTLPPDDTRELLVERKAPAETSLTQFDYLADFWWAEPLAFIWSIVVSVFIVNLLIAKMVRSRRSGPETWSGVLSCS